MAFEYVCEYIFMIMSFMFQLCQLHINDNELLGV